ncbi:chymotrypsin-like protease CTRL-1 [Anopheles ziemanni]|uniref:chymotrypsin-like protease CTRL-1 n=1 Tax=Anopheles coustani TaxID=139045 RepID=UPI00265810CC|nr:chymotrypsin-like protease CTRL-1 [Anopheles coustani]XP_058178145.1 chymotrypsin-like protease CTRL-1 [Anopheles ziemanni]
MVERWILTLLLAVCLVVSASLAQPSAEVGCGKVLASKDPLGLIFNGFESTPGMWPWHVALMHLEAFCATADETSCPIMPLYKCGGTIINRDTVLTAYHCVAGIEGPIEVERLVVRGGLFDLLHEPDQENHVLEVLFPPEASVKTFDGDIAVLKMQTEFEYGVNIQPACIRTTKQPIDDLVEMQGTVIGWGLTERGFISRTLIEANVPVVSPNECLQGDSRFHLALTSKIYCAGSRNGTSSCNGDSGGGMFFYMGGHWFLHGLTSFSPGDPKKPGVCDSHNYVAYTNVAKYITWLQEKGVTFEDPLISGMPTGEMAVGFAGSGNTRLIRLTLNAKLKKLLQQQKGEFLLRMTLNGKKVNSEFE